MDTLSVWRGTGLPTGYAMLGAGWLIMKTGDELQAKAVKWARRVLWPMGLALIASSAPNPSFVATLPNSGIFGIPFGEFSARSMSRQPTPHTTAPKASGFSVIARPTVMPPALGSTLRHRVRSLASSPALPRDR